MLGDALMCSVLVLFYFLKKFRVTYGRAEMTFKKKHFNECCLFGWNFYWVFFLKKKKTVTPWTTPIAPGCGSSMSNICQPKLQLFHWEQVSAYGGNKKTYYQGSDGRKLKEFKMMSAVLNGHVCIFQGILHISRLLFFVTPFLFMVAFQVSGF